MVRTLRIVSQLAALDAKEISVSARRNDLHKRIDLLYLGGVADGTLMNRLEDDKTRMSAQRSVLQHEIDRLRAQVGMSAVVRRNEILPHVVGAELVGAHQRFDLGMSSIRATT